MRPSVVEKCRRPIRSASSGKGTVVSSDGSGAAVICLSAPVRSLRLPVFIECVSPSLFGVFRGMHALMHSLPALDRMN